MKHKAVANKIKTPRSAHSTHPLGVAPKRLRELGRGVNVLWGGERERSHIGWKEYGHLKYSSRRTQSRADSHLIRRARSQLNVTIVKMAEATVPSGTTWVL